MSIRVYLHTSNKRAETPALLDSGATENFINHRYATHMRLPVKKLPNPRKVFNVDGTPNKKGDIQFYTDLEGQNRAEEHQHEVLPHRPRPPKNDPGISLVCSSPTKNRLGKRMDRLRTTTRSNQNHQCPTSPIC